MRRIITGMALFFLALCILGPSCALAADEVSGAISPASWRDGNCYFIEGKVNQVLFHLRSQEKKRYESLRIILDLPRGFNILALSDFQCGTTRPLAPGKLDITAIEVKGKAYNRHTITLLPGELLPHGDFRQAVVLVIQPSSGSLGEHEMQWQLQWENAGHGAVMSMKAIVLPAPASCVTPKKILLMPQRWMGMPWTLPGGGREICSEWIDFFKAMGANSLGYSGSARDPWPAAAAAGNLAFMGYCMPQWMNKGLPEAVDNPAIDSNGRNLGTVSPTYVVEQGMQMGFFNTWIKNYTRRYAGRSGDMVAVDFEPANAMRDSFDAASIRAFSQWSGLPADGLTVKNILEEHRRKWVAFRCWQNAQALKHFGQAVHEAVPGAKALSMSVHMFAEDQLEDKLERFAMDVRQIDKIPSVDGHLLMLYDQDVKRFMADTGRTVQAVSKPVYPMMMFQSPYSPTDFSGYQSPLGAMKGRQEIIGGVAEGARGIAVWPMDIMDGKDWLAFARAARELALLEDFFVEGWRREDFCRVTGLPDEEYYVELAGQRFKVQQPKWKDYLLWRSFSRGDETLTLIFNLHASKTGYFEMVIPDAAEGRYILYDPTTNSAVRKSGRIPYFSGKDLRKGVLCRVDAQDIGFYVLRRDDGSRKYDRIILEEELRRDYRKVSDNFSKTGTGIRSLEKNGISMRPAAPDENGSPVIAVENAVQKVEISTAGGRIKKWTVGKGEREIVYWSDREGGLGMDLFQNAAWNGEEREPYEVLLQEADKGSAAVRMQRKLNNPLLRGLILTKEYVINSRLPRVEVRYHIRNEGDASREVRFWVHNMAGIGKKEIYAAGRELLDEQWLVVPGTEGNRIFDKTTRQTDIFCATEGDNSGARSLCSISRGWAAAYCPLTGEALLAETDYGQLSRIYGWRGKTPTLEFLYKPISLAAGQEWQTSLLFSYLSGIKADDISPAQPLPAGG